MWFNNLSTKYTAILILLSEHAMLLVFMAMPIDPCLDVIGLTLFEMIAFYFLQ